MDGPKEAAEREKHSEQSRADGITQESRKRNRPSEAMDEEVIKRNQALYNRHANVDGEDRKRKQRERDQGMAAPLKQYHNTVKRLLIQRFALGADRLLDIACGRGGDLRKWADAGVKYVRGYDSAEAECEEARHRLEDLKVSQPDAFADLQAKFVPTTDIGKRVWKDDTPYDAVTCMFALHYFFGTEAAAKATLEFASVNLRDGGYFFGALPDGKRVLDTIGPALQFKMVGLKIKALWSGPPQPFGSAYSCAIADTVTQGHDDDDTGSYEYLVYQKILVALGAQYDLWPVTEYDDFELDEYLDPPQPSSDGTKLFRRFKASFQAEHPSINTASKLNCSFVFVKGKKHLDGGQAVGKRSAPEHEHGRGDTGEGLEDAGPPGDLSTAADARGEDDEHRTAARGAPSFKRPSRAKKRA